MVENGADAWKEGQGEHKKNFTLLQDLQISAKLEETFLEGCRKPPGTCHHVQNQSRRMRRRNTHGFLHKCQPPACQRIPVATTDRSGWTQCQAEKTGDIEQTNAWARQQKRRANLHRNHEHMAQQREGPNGQHLADFATLPSAVVKVARA